MHPAVLSFIALRLRLACKLAQKSCPALVAKSLMVTSTLQMILVFCSTHRQPRLLKQAVNLLAYAFKLSLAAQDCLTQYSEPIVRTLTWQAY